jgi:NAD(P)H-dependent FMN reductase
LMAVQDDNTLALGIVIASTRPVRVGKPVGDWIAAVARETPGWCVDVADLREIDLPLMNEPRHPRFRDYEHDHTKAWSAWVDARDAFVFVFPEYNHTFTAPIKNALDYVSQEWAFKPVGLVSYGGVSGGLRAAQALKPPLTALKMMPIPEAVTVQSVSQHVNGDVFTPIDSVTRSAVTMLEQLHRWSVALKPLRTGTI